MLQGLAIGGEYGGAAIYVAEHVPENRRGFYTSFIQVTAGLGMFISLAVIIATQQSMTDAAFSNGAGACRFYSPSSWSLSPCMSAFA